MKIKFSFIGVGGSIVKNNIFYESGNSDVFFDGGYLVSAEASLPKNCDIDKNVYFVKGNKKLQKNI